MTSVKMALLCEFFFRERTSLLSVGGYFQLSMVHDLSCSDKRVVGLKQVMRCAHLSMDRQSICCKRCR